MKLGCVTNSFFHYTEQFGGFFHKSSFLLCCELSQREEQRRRRKEAESFSGQKTLTWVSSLMCDRQVIKCLVILERATNCQPLWGAWQREGQQKSQTSLLFPRPLFQGFLRGRSAPPLRRRCRSQHKYEQTPKAKAFRGTCRRLCSTTAARAANTRTEKHFAVNVSGRRYTVGKPTVTEQQGAVVTRSPQQELFCWGKKKNLFPTFV